MTLSLPLTRPAEALSVTVTDRPGPALLDGWRALVAGRDLDGAGDGGGDGGGDVAQLPEWAALRGTVGFVARYVFVHRDGVLLGGAQVLERPLPLLGRVGYVSGGPVLAGRLRGEPGLRTAVVAALSDALAESARGRGALFVQPAPGAEAVSAALLERGFRLSDAEVAPGQTLRVDLRRSPEQLRAGLSKRLRTWTNRWAERGVTVRPATEADLPKIAELVASSGEHHGYLPVSADYLRTLCRELPGTVAFVGSLEGEPVAAAVFTRCAGTMKLRFAGMDRDERVGRANVPAAVQWHAMNWARAAGERWFDSGGISAESAALLESGGRRDAMRGVDRFKASFGGSLYRYPPAVELIASAPVRLGYDVSRRWSGGRRAIELAKRLLRTGRLARG